MLKLKRKPRLTEAWRIRQGGRLLLPPPESPASPTCRSQSTQSGFTIIESLMAMLIATILLAGLSPLFVLAVSSRVQARRVDLATQAARSYIDSLRADVIQPPFVQNADFSLDDLGVPAPPNPPNQPANPGTCLDKNLQRIGCADAFLVIQAFRQAPARDANGDGSRNGDDAKLLGYCVGVRVYRGDAFKGGSPDQVKPLNPMFAETANTKEYPLVVMKTEIINQATFETYQGSPCSP